MEPNTNEEGKTMAIISHLWVVGLIIAIVMNGSKKNAFAAYYIRQMMGLLLLSIGFNILFQYVISISLVIMIINIALFVAWILSFIGAVQGKKSPTPMLGEQFQSWFKSIG